MNRLVFLFRISLLFCLFCVPAFLVVTFFSSLKVGIIGTSILFILMFCGLFLNECIISKVFTADANVPLGLMRSLDCVLRSSSSFRRPKLLIYSDPLPNIIAVKSLGSKGTILLSKGLIHFLSEDEIRAVFVCCVNRLNEPGVIVQSYCSVLAFLIFKLVPNQWTKLIFADSTIRPSDPSSLSPTSMMRFLAFYPMIQLLMRLGRQSSLVPQELKNSNSYSAAMQKIFQTNRLWGNAKSEYSLIKRNWIEFTLYSALVHLNRQI